MRGSAAKSVTFEEINMPETHTITGAIIGWRQIDEEKGRGVFALRDIKKGETVEVAPVIPVSKTAIPDDGGAPDGYLLNWDEDTEGEEHCMPLGYIMLYNHGDKPNLRLECDMNEYTIAAIATKDIVKGEELTWDYACEIWFDQAE